MRLLVIGDIHGDVRKIPLLKEAINIHRPDTLVVCGDITHFGSLAMACKILKSLQSLDLPIFFVPGNCDPKELASKVTVEGSENLHGRCMMFAGRNIIGVGGCVSSPFEVPFELSEAEVKGILAEAYRKCSSCCGLVVVSHCPPYGTKVDKTSFNQHVGSRALKSFLLSTKPILLVCGHIHEARGIDFVNTTHVVNPGPLNRGFYSIVDLEKVEIILGNLEKKS
ncbi:MAG: metallophosphoesterase [Candidatus Bathyarchaeia archaeon]